jgi:hypothetical protein
MVRSRFFGIARALAGMACRVAPAARQGRHFRLSDGGGAAPGTVRFLSQSIELASGAATSWVTVTRTGDFSDERYGNFSITGAMLSQMVSNFDKRVLGQDVYIDVAHRHSDGAAAKVLRLAVEGGKLRALVEWTDFGREAVNVRGFSYLSAEFHENWVANEAGATSSGCVLLGAGLTIRPVIKHLDSVGRVQLSTDDNDHAPPVRLLISPNLLKQLSTPDNNTMNKHLQTLLARLIKLSYTEASAKPLLDAAQKQLEGQTDETKCLAVVDSFVAAGETAMTQIKAAGGDGKSVVITLAEPQPPIDIAQAVAKALAERETANAQAVATLEGKKKLLSETITAGGKTLSADDVVKLSAEYAPLIGASSTDDQVKHLATVALSKQQEISSAVKLAGLGYHIPGGNVRITVDSTNEVKSLQETLDKRLGLTNETGDTKRFFGTGGVLLAQNKAFAEKVLAEYDHIHGPQLHAEHKMLAAGVGTVSDIKVPASFERTVLREALYNLTSLSFMDVGTAALAPSINIPYSYRDLSAAGSAQTLIYEGQGIPNAGIIQTWDTAYPIPQKLAFRVSNEMQYLLAAGPINFDAIAENALNVIRIVGENTEALNLNEIVRSADEHLASTITDTLTAQVNGTKTVFVTTKFPVVRPRTRYDLKGNVAEATTNAVTVMLNAVARNEYLPPANGSALAAGTYWVMDYNLGELRFVNESGVTVVPTNGWVLTVAYSYSLNASKFDVDLGAQTVGQRYDDLLTIIGSRRVVIENDRYYRANMALMTGGVNNALGQATTFSANASRLGTSLNADGTVGVTKGVPTFQVSAPGMMLNDNRIIVGESKNSRFRMCKAWAMGPMQEARNSAGNFIAMKEGYGEQYIVSHTPVSRKNAATSVILYSGTGRVSR